MLRSVKFIGFVFVSNNGMSSISVSILLEGMDVVYLFVFDSPDGVDLFSGLCIHAE